MTRSMILSAVCALAFPFAAQAAQPAPAPAPAPAPVAEHKKGDEHKGMKHDGEGCECCKKMAADKARQGAKVSESAAPGAATHAGHVR